MLNRILASSSFTEETLGTPWGCSSLPGFLELLLPDVRHFIPAAPCLGLGALAKGLED